MVNIYKSMSTNQLKKILIKKGFKVITFPAEWKKRVEGSSSITIESYFSYLKVLLRNI